MDQLDIFAERYPLSPGHRGRATQIAAAKKIAPRVPRLHKQVLDCLNVYGPQTRHEISARTGIALQSVCGRVRELTLLGAIKDTDERRDGGRVVRAA